MSYVGNTPTQQAFTPAVDFFNGNGSTTAFTLSRPVASVAQVQAVISNVPQKPGDAYTVSGNTITFTSAPPSGTQNIYVYYTSPITQVIAPGQGTVGTAQLQDGAVITQDIADGAVTPAKLSTGAPTWTSAGKLLVGASSSDLTSTSQAMIIGSGGLAVQNGGSTGTFLKITPDTANGSVTLAADARSGSYPPLVFSTGAVERGRFNAGAPILCLSGGNTSATGTGIAFPATQSASTDANTLDDYEEGIWTPTDGSGAGLTFSGGTSGRYTKIGRCVFVDCEVGYPSTASTASAAINGLPFTSRATSDYNSGTCMSNSNLNVWSFINSNTTAITLYQQSASFAQPTNANLSGATLYISIWYLTAY